MKIMNRIVFAAALIILCAIAGFVIAKRSASHQIPKTASTPRAEEPKPIVVATATGLEPGVSLAASEPLPPPQVELPTNAAPAKTSSAKKAARPPKEPLKDPDARAALALVGADPDAEAYWFGAINDPSLSPGEREDLIEDLNEEGLSDPKNPTLDDLPLILRRLELIELLAPYAMDQNNLNAFEEAFKDLKNLALLTVGRGQPVQ